MAEPLQHAANGLKVQHGARQLHAVAQGWLPIGAEESVVDGGGALVVNVHRSDAEARPALLDLFLRRTGRLAGRTPPLEPLQHAGVPWWMGGIDGSQLAPDLVHDDVREARALGRVGGAAEAASAVNIVAGLRHGAIAPDLGQLPPETLVVSAAVEHRDLDG